MKAKKPRSSSRTENSPAAKTAEDREVFRIPNKGTPGADHTKVVDWMDSEGGMVTTARAIEYVDNKWKMNFPWIMMLLTNPCLEGNNWSCLVEQVSINGVPYLRLVRTIPMSVKEKWDKTRKPPRVTVDWKPLTGTNPYPSGSVYYKLFEIAKEFQPKDEILRRAARITKKTKSEIGIAWSRVRNPKDVKGARKVRRVSVAVQKCGILIEQEDVPQYGTMDRDSSTSAGRGR